MKQSAKKYKRVVIKIGSSLFYDGKDLDFLKLFEIVSNIAALVKLEAREVVIVSSGAIALGMQLLKLNARPNDLSSLQASAAIGQNILIRKYSDEFNKFGLNCAQVLLTWDDFNNRKRYINAKNSLLKLIELGVIPIVNENDTISTEEIKFGDNDRLSSLVATLIGADLLIMLSDVDGLLDKNKRVIRIVDQITNEIKRLACPSSKKSCVGGMVTKLEAANISISAGIPCVIANGGKAGIISRIAIDPINNMNGDWTLFAPKRGFLTAKEHWITFGAKPKGKVLVDDGAKKALLNRKSLLSVGILSIGGDFEKNDVVTIRDKDDLEFARGKVGISSDGLNKIKGKRHEKEIIHRDNIVINR